MTDGRTDGRSEAGRDGMVASLSPGLQRERSTVRRRRARPGHRAGPRWGVTRSRRNLIRTFALCAGALLAMAISLYFGLSHQESAGPGAARGVSADLGVV